MRRGMDPTAGTHLGLAERRLAWLEARQRVLSQNIAHADTPGYRPRDLRPFAAVLAGQAGGVGLARTDPLHLAAARGAAADPAARPDRRTAERARNGNAVALDTQALKVADTDSAHGLALGLHRRTMAMFRTALGRP
jgi:flagellar basal-body rod protein FlgB